MKSATTARFSRSLVFRCNIIDSADLLSTRCQKLVDDLKSCGDIVEVSRIHGYMVKTGIDQDVFAVSKLLAFSVHDIRYASSIFEHVSNTNLYMFNTMLRGYSISDEPEQAFRVFNHLRSKGFTLDRFSFITTLKSCARLLDTRTGEGVHGIALRFGFVSFTDLMNTLLHFYCVCGRINDARNLFDEMPHNIDAVSFGTLMNGYLQISKHTLALDLFRDMRKCEVSVNVSTLLSFLSATGDIGDFSRAESAYGLCIKSGLEYDLHLLTALIGMFAKLEDIRSARKIFDCATRKDVVVWNCMIDQYAKMGLLEECLWLLRQMKYEHMKPSSSTFVGLLSSCAACGATSVGQSVGELAEEEGLGLDAVLGTALIDMYAKLGILDKAIEIFNKMKNKDVKSWTAMISGYGAHGLSRKAIDLFHQMEEDKSKVKPNEITFLVVLNACSHGGLIAEGIKYFKKMVETYNYTPKVEHYGCVVDLLGRAGQLKEAYALITSLPITIDSTAWRALLAACRVYGNAELGEQVMMELVEMGEKHPTDAILLAGTHVVAGNSQVQQKDLDNELYKEKKEAGYSAIEIE